MTSEFEIIKRYFSGSSGDAVLGVGDDGAILNIDSSREMVVTMDTLVCDRHFAKNADPESIGFKSLAVNLSDLAAMGARPRHILLSITLPSVHEAWISRFRDGFKVLLDRYSLGLVGGDTTKGSTLSVSVTAIGDVATGAAIRRDSISIGDDLWVSGIIGLGAIGLLVEREVLEVDPTVKRDFLDRLHRPMPRVELGQALSGVASAAIDVSDGLVADALHLANSSEIALEIEFDKIPVHHTLSSKKYEATVQDCILGGGDDYELLFSAPREMSPAIQDIATQCNLALTRIGKAVPGRGVTILDQGISLTRDFKKGFDHFDKRD